MKYPYFLIKMDGLSLDSNAFLLIGSNRQSLTKSYFIRSFQVVIFGCDPNIWPSKNVPISREPKKKTSSSRTWNFVVSYGHLLHWHFPPTSGPVRRAEGLQALDAWKQGHPSCSVVENNHRTWKIIIFPRGFSTRSESPLPGITMFCWKPLEKYREKLTQGTSMYKAFEFRTARGTMREHPKQKTSLLSATTTIHIDSWKNIYAKITLPFPHLQTCRISLPFFS